MINKKLGVRNYELGVTNYIRTCPILLPDLVICKGLFGYIIVIGNAALKKGIND